MNPIGNVFCSRCNARLLSIEMQLPEKPKPAEEAPVGVKGISLPTLPTAKEGALEPEELPDWLLELTEQSLGKPADTPGMEEPAPAEEFPDWLSGVMDDTAGNVVEETADTPDMEESAPAEEFPDWLSGLMDDAAGNAVEETVDAFTTDEFAAEDAPALSELPDWFSDLTDDVSAPEEIAPAEPAESVTPDWLAGLLEDEPTGPAEAVFEAEAAAAEEEPALEELPDWLSDMTPEEPDVAPATDIFDIAPPLSAQETVALPETDRSLSNFAAEPHAELPDWLLATAAPAPSGEAPTAQPLPEWLRKDATEPTPGQEAGEQRELPAWLLKDAESGATPSQPMPIEAEEQAHLAAELAPSPLPIVEPEEELEGKPEPDWLADLYPEEEPELQAEPASSTPDWLAGIYSEEEAEPSATAFIAEPEEEEIAPETSVPDWLAGIMAEEPVPEQPQAPSEDEEATTGMDVPDWLAGLETKAPSTEEKQPASLAADRAIFIEAAPDQPRAGPSDTPDWLRGTTPQDEETDLEPVQPAFVPGEAAFDMQEDEEPALEAGEIPDWLKGLSPTTPSPIEKEVAFYDRVSEDESLVRAEVPSWLQGLRPPGTGPLPPLPEMMAPGVEAPPPQEGGLVQADIPDWVQQLRPVPSAEGEAGEKQLLEPAETEGPLAGLRGVLPVGSPVDMPADFQPAPPAPIPESIMTQAQLWQKLLEQPRSVQRPVAQHRARSGSGQLAARWIVTVVLLAVTVLGLLWSDARLSQALSSPHIEHFSKAIEALEAGDTVIVAVEYGPAEAGEMTILAQAVVKHLAERNARVMMVSTLPEGAGLIHSLLDPLALANRLPAGQPAYLPGLANGVAQFLSEPSEAKMIIVLAGRAERLRWWVEQNNAMQATIQTRVLPMAIGVNAATAPLAMPYLETAPVTGWIAGLSDFAAYQEFRGLSSSVLNSQLDALMLAHWAALALLLFGLFYYLALGKKGAS